MAQPKTALSPEWDRWFDETFTDLVSSDEELARGEFDALISASYFGVTSQESLSAGPDMPSMDG